AGGGSGRGPPARRTGGTSCGSRRTAGPPGWRSWGSASPRRRPSPSVPRARTRRSTRACTVDAVAQPTRWGGGVAATVAAVPGDPPPPDAVGDPLDPYGWGPRVAGLV